MRPRGTWPLRIGIAVAALSWLACSDESIVDPEDPTVQGENVPGLVVSDPAAIAGAEAQATLAPSGNASGSLVYVSLGPGAVTGGSRAVVRRVGDAAALSVPVVDGGFDPIPVAAHVGDSVEVTVTDLAATSWPPCACRSCRRGPPS